MDVKSDALLLSLGVNPLYSFLPSNQSSKYLPRNHFPTPPIDYASSWPPFRRLSLDNSPSEKTAKIKRCNIVFLG
jgi:hypothetical protein